MVKRDDVYKSSAVTVSSGEPANSVSWPPAERKQVAPRPVTSGKLLRPGGPSQSASVRDVATFPATTGLKAPELRRSRNRLLGPFLSLSRYHRPTASLQLLPRQQCLVLLLLLLARAEPLPLLP